MKAEQISKNIEKKKCIVCNKTFFSYKKNRKGKARVRIIPNIRTPRSITCSPKCSKKYSTIKRRGGKNE
jgi:hypothetical protein